MKQKNELATLSPNQSNCYAADPRDFAVLEAGTASAMSAPFHGQCGDTNAEYERLLREGERAANASNFREVGEAHPDVNKAGTPRTDGMGRDEE